MNGVHANSRRPALRRIATVSAVVAAALLAALVLLYLATPALVTWLGPRLAARYGLNSLDVEIGRPGLHGLELRRLALANDAFTVVGRDATLRYSLAGIRNGNLDSVEFDVLEIARTSAVTTPVVETQPATAWQVPTLPIDRVRIDHLVLRSADIGFVGTGNAEIGDGALSVAIDGVEPAAASRFSLTATLDRGGRYQAIFGERGDTSREFLRVQGLIGADAIRVDADVELRGYALALLVDMAGLPQGSGSVSGIIHTDIPWPVPEPFDWRTLNLGVPELEVGWRSTQPEVVVEKLNGRLAVTAGHVTGSLSGDVAFVLPAGAVELSMPSGHRFDLQDGRLTGTGGLQVRLSRDTDRLEADVHSYTLATHPERRLSVEGQVTGNVLGADIDGNAKGDLRLGSWQPASGDGRLSFTGGVDIAGWSRRGTLTTGFRFAGDQWQLEGTASTGILGAVPFKVELDSAAGSGSLSAHPRFEVTKPLAKTMLGDWQGRYDLDKGRIDAGLRLRWGTPGVPLAEVDLSVRNGRAHFDQDTATGISADLKLAFDDARPGSGRTLQPATVHIDKVDAGLEMGNVTATLTYSGGQLEFGGMDAEILGGRARAGPFTYGAVTGDATFTLHLSDIGLSEILALEGEDVVGTGKLDATLPVTLRNNLPSVEQGSFRAQAPGGRIQVTPTLAGLTSQSGLEFALVALKDFNYTDLTGEIDYAESGDLKLAIHLKGNNQAVEKGRAIQYNLTINENVPTLLESLRMSDRVTERIGRDVVN